MTCFVAATVPDRRQNFICIDVQQKLWKHRNLDGMAVWLDCRYSTDADFYKKSESSWNNSAQSITVS
ncbi:MAG: hypothetical protein ACLUTA_03000 [Blautia wexlerae]